MTNNTNTISKNDPNHVQKVVNYEYVMFEMDTEKALKADLETAMEVLGLHHKGLSANAMAISIKGVQAIGRRAKKEADERVKEAEKKAESRTPARKSTKRSPRQEFVDLAKGKVADIGARFIINPAWELEEGANGTEKTVFSHGRKLISVLHQGGCLNTEYEKLVRKAFPKE